MTKNALFSTNSGAFGEDVLSRFMGSYIRAAGSHSCPLHLLIKYTNDKSIRIWKGRSAVYELQERCTGFFELCDALIIDDSGGE